jgi:hypothetical protein
MPRRPPRSPVTSRGSCGVELYNRERPHQGRGMHGGTPGQAFTGGVPRIPAKETHVKTPPQKAA